LFLIVAFFIVVMLNAALHPSLVSCLFSERALAAAEVERLDIALFNFKAVHAQFFFSTPDLQFQRISSCASLKLCPPSLAPSFI
jgi:hypothetical protein